MRRFLFIGVLSAVPCLVFADGLPQVADGYTIEKVAGDPLVRHPMMANFDDRGRLFIAESAGKNLRADDLLKETPNFIRMIEDEDGDGVFDKSTIFADNMTLPQGALWHRGALYVAAPPNIWRLEDTDDDGVADKRDILVDTFGFNGNAASIHGPFLGPTGRIFWCDGRHGHEFKDEEGQVTSKGKAARIFSCRPDGTDVRTWCGGGMDNPVEVDFTPEGEMIGTVNLFYGRPRGDCLVHWVEGGVYPRHDQQACIDEFVRTGELLTEIKNFGHVAVSGMLRRRAVENDELEIITTIFNTGKLIRSRLSRSGSTFTSVEDELMSSTAEDFHPTDVVEDADGSLLVIDTGGWFRIGCPTSQIAKPDVAGGIYRIRKTNSSRVEDPRGLKIVFDEQTEDQLVALLDDERFVVRERAIDELAQRESAAIEPLRIVLSYTGDASVRKRRNAVWAAARIHSSAAHGLLLTALEDDSASVRLAALRAISKNNRRNMNDSVYDKFWAAARKPQVNKEQTRQPEPNKEPLPESILDVIHYLPMQSMYGPVVGVSALRAVSENDRMAMNKRVVEKRDPELLFQSEFEVEQPIIDAEKLARHLPYEFDVAVQRAIVDALHISIAHYREQPTVERFSSKTATTKLFQTIRKADPVLDHSIVSALIRVGDWPTIETYVKSTKPNEQRVALLALSTKIPLDQLVSKVGGRRVFFKLLGSRDARLQKEALRVIEATPGLTGLLDEQIERWLLEKTPTLERRYSLASLLERQIEVPTIQELIGKSAVDNGVPAETRRILFGSMRASSQLVDGWIPAIRHGLDEPYTSAIRTAAHFDRPEFTDALQKLISDPLAGTEARTEAIMAMAPRLKTVTDESFELLTDRMHSAEPLDAMRIAEKLAGLPLNSKQLITIAQQLPTTGPLIQPILLTAFESSADAEVGQAVIQMAQQKRAVVDAGDLRRTLSKYPESVRNAIPVAQVDQDRQTKLKSLSHLLEDGDPVTGKKVFRTGRIACTTCHSINGDGGRVGPDLTKIGAIRSGRDLLEAIIYPSASFARGYQSYSLVTDSGRIHTGLIERQTRTEVVLKTAELKQVRVPLSEVDELVESPISMMPKGLETVLTDKELRDLLSYLQQLK